MTAVTFMVTYMYSGRVGFGSSWIDDELLRSDSDVLELFQAAHFYAISTLVDLCVQSLCAWLTVDSVSEILYVADKFDNSDLKDACLSFIREHLAEVQATDTFRKFVFDRSELLRPVSYTHLTLPTKRIV